VKCFFCLPIKGPSVGRSLARKSLSKVRRFHYFIKTLNIIIKCFTKILFLISILLYTRHNANHFRSCRFITIHQSNPSIRLTGKAGTKPPFTEIIQTTHKNTVVVALPELLPLNARSYDSHPCFSCV
jgi:hypothetical protein